MGLNYNGAPEVTRGDMYYIENAKITDNASYEGGRPAIIVSNDQNNKFGQYVEVVYLTTQDKKPLPTHVQIMSSLPSTVLCESIYTINKDRLGTFIRACTEEEMQEVDKALAISLGLEFSEEPEKTVMQEDTKTKTELEVYKKLYSELLERLIKNGV